MNYNIVRTDAVDIMTLDPGDTFYFSEDNGANVCMIVDNPFLDCPAATQKAVQSFCSEYSCLYWYVSLNDGSVSYCVDNYKVIPVYPVNEICFTPTLE